jgi:phage baseplate assembly protein W
MVNRSDKFTLKQKEIERYSDFSTTFEMNPFSGMLARVTNEEAVKQSLKNLVLTETGERFYDSNKGSKIKQSLFELVKIQLKASLASYEPRANIIDVQLSNDQLDANALNCKIIFSVINIPGPTFTLDLNVTRVR